MSVRVTSSYQIVFLYTPEQSYSAPENLRISVPKMYILVINRSKFQEAKITGQFLPKVPKLYIQFDNSSFNVFKEQNLNFF